MNEMRGFQFKYHPRGPTHLWDHGESQLMHPGSAEGWKHREVRVIHSDGSLIIIGVYDQDAFVQVEGEKKFDSTDAEDIADEEFRRRFPDRSLQEPQNS